MCENGELDTGRHTWCGMRMYQVVVRLIFCYSYVVQYARVRSRNGARNARTHTHPRTSNGNGSLDLRALRVHFHTIYELCNTCMGRGLQAQPNENTCRNFKHTRTVHNLGAFRRNRSSSVNRANASVPGCLWKHKKWAAIKSAEKCCNMKS